MRLNRQLALFSYMHEGALYEGRKALLVIGTKGWPTVEIATKNARPYVWLRLGRYTVEMAEMGNGRRALRVLATGRLDSYPSMATLEALKAGRVYVHGIEGPELRVDHLKGCVGVGIERTERGVTQPALAMDQIFDALDGFKLGAQFELEVA